MAAFPLGGHEMFSGSETLLPMGTTWASSKTLCLVELVRGKKWASRVLKAPLVILMGNSGGRPAFCPEEAPA